MKTLTWSGLVVVGAGLVVSAVYRGEAASAESVARLRAPGVAAPAEADGGMVMWLKGCATMDCQGAESAFARRYELVPAEQGEGPSTSCTLREVTDVFQLPYFVFVEEPVEGGIEVTLPSEASELSDCTSPSSDCTDVVVACNMGC